MWWLDRMADVGWLDCDMKYLNLKKMYVGFISISILGCANLILMFYY